MQILFMCTHNSCRSILSEALFNHLAPAGMTAVSSGSWPSGQVNVRALKTLEAACISTDGLTSKASDVFEHSPPDIVITVCDRAAGEACPVFFFGPALKFSEVICVDERNRSTLLISLGPGQSSYCRKGFAVEKTLSLLTTHFDQFVLHGLGFNALCHYPALEVL
ncbi:low molecular weight phosphotyrosine protein phosphatase [Marinobacter sp. LV10MA510-1]|nr:low molecular weight phosphotyrosine protein phosphatase [Marinobacter sp. LV10MA510-1]